jgi:hypothetical protein
MIPTPKSVGTDENSGESDKTESASLDVLRTSAFSKKALPDLGLITSCRGSIQGRCAIKSIVEWTIYKERIGNSTVGK